MKEKTRVSQKKVSGKTSRKDRHPCFIMVEGDYIGELYQLDRALTAIGRNEDCDIVLLDPGVSRRHAKVVHEKEGHVIQDLHSTNGTYVNGSKVENQALKDGDKVTVGGVVLKYCYQDEIDVSYQKKLRSLAIKDGLTKIYNKKHFEGVLHREFAYAARHGNVFSLVMLDIDHFKKVNDEHGHQAGDYVLRNLAKVLNQQVREYDTFARFGGEEFIFLLRNVGLDNAVVFAERIRRKVAGTPFLFEGVPLKVTISVGVAVFPGQKEGIDPAALIKQADRYLYAAKHNGRNRVASALYE
jgi:two-component system, cell cycle response regulator